MDFKRVDPNPALVNSGWEHGHGAYSDLGEVLPV